MSLRTLQALVQDLQRTYPHAGARIDHAAFLLLARRVERSQAGHWWVGSESEPDCGYLVMPVAGSCTCQDYQRHGSLSPCRHQLCVELLQRLERVEAETTDPTAAPIPFELTERAFTVLAHLQTCARCGRQARRVNVDWRARQSVGW